MNSLNGQYSMNRISDVLGSVRKKGGRLWSENGQLHYEAPRGALTQEDIEMLRLSSGEIVALLEKAKGAEAVEPGVEPRAPLHRAPLAFSQLAHWRLYRLSARRAMRQVAFAKRLRGRLDVDALRRSAAELVRRHEALRTRIVVLDDGIPIQEIRESANCEFRLDDLTVLAESCREAEVKRLIEQFILEPIDVAVAPLFGLRLLKIRDNEHVLIMAAEHMISDGFSLSILARELFAAYIQALRGQNFSLPAIPVQFADYAIWQTNARRSSINKEATFWNERLSGSQLLRFPEDKRLQTAGRLGRGTVPLRIESNLKAELLEWCRLRRTTLVLGAFTAYVGLVLRWCDAAEGVIKYVIDGRVSPPINNTVGFFASVLHLRVGLLKSDGFVDLLTRVSEEYCRAYEHADVFSYMAAQLPPSEFMRNTRFNWLPQGAFETDLSELNDSEDALTCSQVTFVHPAQKDLELDEEPWILLYDTDDDIVGGMYFPLNRFSVESMERFARNYLLFIRALVRHPEARVNDVMLV